MNKIKNIARILIFVVLLGLIFSGLDPLMTHKDSLLMVKPFLDTAQEYDVLFFGDSMVRAGIYPLELYNKYGIASYNLSSRNCRIPMGYWRMMNVLDYMTPKLIAFSIMDLEWPELTYDKGERLHDALDTFPLTLTKAKGILELTDQEGVDRNGVPFSEIRSELFFPLRKYHSRWNSLTQEDFSPVYNKQKGAEPIVHVSDPDIKAALMPVDDCAPEEGYGFVYLRKIIEECQRREIPLLLYVPPHPIRPLAHRTTHTAAKIAAEYGVPMINFTDMDRVIDHYTDCGDPGGHLNTSGAYKLTDYMGQYLTDHYDLPDRREDSNYAHWDEQWDAYLDEKIRAIQEDPDSLRSQIMRLHDESFNVILTVRANFDYDYRETKRAIQNIAREHVFEDDELVSGKLYPLDGLSDAADFNQGYMLIVDRDAGEEYDAIHEFYGLSEQEFETSFGYVFCRMDGEWIDLSITQDDEETYYFESWEEQEADIRFILIDRRTGKPVLAKSFSRTEAELSGQDTFEAQEI